MKNKKVLLFLARGFEEYEAGVFTDVIGWSRVFGNEAVDVVSTGLDVTFKLLEMLTNKENVNIVKHYMRFE